MNTPDRISEPPVAYATSVSNLHTPVILEHGGQPFAVVLSYEEFKKLQAIRSDEEQRIRLGWWGLERLLGEIHRRPSEPGLEEIEADGSTGSPHGSRRPDKKQSDCAMPPVAGVDTNALIPTR